MLEREDYFMELDEKNSSFKIIRRITAIFIALVVIGVAVASLQKMI